MKNLWEMFLMIDDRVYEELNVVEVVKDDNVYNFKDVLKNVISEISLKIIVNDTEVASLLCLNQHQEELAIGFLFSEGVINSFSDIKSIYYNERQFAVIISLENSIAINRQESLRSVTTGCGNCVTYINPLKHSSFEILDTKSTFFVGDILERMKSFVNKSELFKAIGGVHSVLFHSNNYELLNEDIGRHNCFDKIAGIMMREEKLEHTKEGMIFVSGRISSEIVIKVIRLKVPVIVSRSTPTTSAVKLATKYNVTLMGYVRNDKGYIYTCPWRIIN
jgi:FdhD protein